MGVVGDEDFRGKWIGEVEPVEFFAGEAVDVGSGLFDPAQNVVEGAVFHD